jgi:hypothetical protein
MRLWASSDIEGGKAVVDMQPLRTIAYLTGPLKMEAIIAEAAKPGLQGQRMQQFANIVGSSIKFEE